jgi:hypothetical protein
MRALSANVQAKSAKTRLRGLLWGCGCAAALATACAPEGGDARGAEQAAPSVVAPEALVMGGSPAGNVVARQHAPQAEHCVQSELNAIADPRERFEEAFECGDELFETRFNALDGVGANVGSGQRFTRVPRADKLGLGEWANHTPRRFTGPNAEACNACHNDPFDDGAGPASVNVIRDPEHRAHPAWFINRNTPHLFAIGALQRLAEEMTDELQAQRNRGRERACRRRTSMRVDLQSKGVSFGSMVVACNGRDRTRDLEGIDGDLVVKPLQWKGNTKTVRQFNRDASHGELGMQAVEIVGENVDGDGDGVVNELGFGDQTALAIYLAAQPRPVTKLELADAGLASVSPEERDSIGRGAALFEEADCATCHVPALVIDDPIFSEPSQNRNFQDDPFPAGQDPIAVGVDPVNPISFDLTRDQPDNVIDVGGTQVRLGAFEASEEGGAIVRLYGDLKRHYMGSGLAESVDETGTGASVWITKELWGVGSTAPYMHDGRSTTLSEAILEHGGEARPSREAFERMSHQDRSDLIEFLNNLVLFKLE